MKRKEEAMKKYIMYKPSSTTYDYIGVPFSQAVVVMEQKIILRSLL